MFKKLLKGIFGDKGQKQDLVEASSGAKENWSAFKRYAGDDYFLVLINSSFASDSQVNSMKWFELVYNFLPEQLVDGWMPTPEAADLFTSLEDKIDQEISAVGGRMAACQTGSGLRRVWYCAPNTKLEVYLHTKAKAFDKIPLTVRPASVAQFERLMPTHLESKLMHNERILHELLKHGDDGSEKRQVMYWITDFEVGSSSKLQGALRKRGYTIEEAADDFIRFSRKTSLKLEKLNAEAKTLVAFCENSGCVYDGWETPVVKSTLH